MVIGKGGAIMIKFNAQDLPSDPKTSHKIIDKTFEANQAENELGVLGKFFGSGDTVKMNIAGLLIFVLLFAGICYSAIILLNSSVSNNSKAVSIVEFWGIITPLITLALGFIFGKHQKI